MADISLFNRSLEALRLLGVAEGDMRERLQTAYQQWIPIEPGDLREEDGLRLVALLEKLSEYDDPQAGDPGGGIGRMDDEAVKEVAEEFVTLCESAIVRNRDW